MSTQSRTPKKDIHDEFEYTKGVTRVVHRRKTHKKSRRYKRSTQGKYTEEGHARRV
jgi:hypothetical protein